MTGHSTFEEAVERYLASLRFDDRATPLAAEYWKGRADEYAELHGVDRRAAYRAAKGRHAQAREQAGAPA